MSVVFLGIMCVVTNAYVHGLPLLSPEETTAFNYFERIGIPEAERIKEAEKTYIRSNTNRIVGGESAKNNQIPYQVSIFYLIHCYYDLDFSSDCLFNLSPAPTAYIFV